MVNRWVVLLWIPLCLSLSGLANDKELYWPQWRGPLMNGLAPYSNPPLEWSETQNIDWKVEIPGRGSSTPIIWDQTIYLHTAIPVGPDLESDQALSVRQSGGPVFHDMPYFLATRKQQFVLLAIDRKTGKTRWQKVLREEQPHEGIHPTNTWASGSPVTDGEHVLSFFGSQGLYLMDMEGNLIWEKDLGHMRTRKGWGEGSSPTISRGKIVVMWDHEDQSSIQVLDLKSGRELWRQERDEESTWFTPLVVEMSGRSQIVTTGAKRVRGYDLETGELLWTGPGLTVLTVPSPVFSEGLVYLTSGYNDNILLAIDLEKASGKVEGTSALAWEHYRDTPYVNSPLVYGNSIYFTKHYRGILTSLDAKTGKLRYGPVRLPKIRNVYASPAGAAGRIYLPSREGATLVFEHGPEFKALSVNQLEDGFDASPAFGGDELYLRGHNFLYRISSPSSQTGE